MQGNESLLHICARAHLLRAAKENADPAGAHVSKEHQLCGVAVVILGKGDFLGRDSTGQQFVAHILVNREADTIRRHGQVAKNKLSEPLVRCFAPDAFDFRHCSIHLGPGMVWQRRVMQAEIQCRLSSVRGHKQHVVFTRINPACPQRLRPLDQGLNNLLQFR